MSRVSPLILCASFFMLLVNAAEHEIETGVYSDAVDELFQFPRSSALLGSDKSIVRDGSPNSNPANLPFDSLNELSISYASFFQNSFSSSIFSFAGPVSHRSGIGISLNYVLFPDIEMYQDTTEDGSPLIKDIPDMFSASDIFFTIGYGYRFKLRKGLEAGVGAAVNAKRRRLMDWTGYGIGMDAGIRIALVEQGISMGLLCDNITSSYIRWSPDYQELSYPHLRFSFGFEKELPYIYGRIQLGYTSPDLLSNEGINTYDYDDSGLETEKIPRYSKVYKSPELLFTAGRYGAEYMIMRTVALRAGISSGNIGFGAGLHLFNNQAALDLAYITHELAGTYQLSVTYRW